MSSAPTLTSLKPSLRALRRSRIYHGISLLDLHVNSRKDESWIKCIIPIVVRNIAIAEAAQQGCLLLHKSLGQELPSGDLVDY